MVLVAQKNTPDRYMRLEPNLFIWKMDYDISNYIHVTQWDVTTHSCPNFNGGLANHCWSWGMDYNPYETNDVITYPCPNVS